MMNVWQLKKATDEIIRDYYKELINILESLAKAIAETNADQMFAGLRADDTEIEPAYKPFTIAIKKEKGQPTDRVTLKDTGEFHRSIFVKFEGDKIIIDSDNDLRDKLVKKYGATIFGLTKQNKTALIHVLEKRLNQWAINKLKQ
jgi:hypothetical protein